MMTSFIETILSKVLFPERTYYSTQGISRRLTYSQRIKLALRKRNKKDKKKEGQLAPNTILIRRMICKSHTNRACSRITFKEVILWKLWYWWAGRCLSGPSDSGRWASWTAFSRRKTLPAGGSGEGQTRRKRKVLCRNAGKSGGTEVRQGEGPRVCLYIVWAPPVFETGLRPQKQKSLALLYRFSAEDGPGRSSGFNSHCPRC